MMKRIFKSILVLAMALALSACNLASKEKDYFQPFPIGYFFTTEKLPVEKVIANKIDDKYVFGNIEGYTVLCYVDYSNENNNIYQFDSAIDYQLANSNVDALSYSSMKKENNNEIISYTARIYFDIETKKDELIIYPNIIFMDDKGEIYTSIAEGLKTDDINHMALNYSSVQAKKDEFNYAIKQSNGTQIEVYAQMSVWFGMKQVPEYYLVHQFDKNHQLLSTIKIDPNNYPESISKEENTEYLLQESFYNQGIEENGKIDFEREVFSDGISCVKVNEDSVIERVFIPLR